MKQMILIVALALLIVLAGCQKRGPAALSAPESESQSSEPVQPRESSSSSRPESETPQESSEESPGPQPQLTAHEVAVEFTRAVLASDIQALERIALLQNGVADYWANVRIGSASFTVLQEDTYTGLYAVMLDVLDAGKTNLKEGVGSYVLQIGGMTEGVGVMSLTPAEKHEAQEKSAQDKDVAELVFMRYMGLSESFAQPSELDKDKLLEYLIVLASRDFAVADGEQIYELTQAQIDATAKKHFGMNSFVYTQSKFYDQTAQRYMLFGRGFPFYLNEQPVRVEQRPDGEKHVTFEVYDDSFQTVTGQTILYTMRPNGDGSYYTASAVVQ